MEKNIYIIGDITKDVYLRLDNRKNQLYSDENGMFWLDLAFDNRYHRYFKRTSIFGGTAVSADVLNRFGIKPTISACEIGFENETELIVSKNPYNTYRYIICKDNDTAVFAPSTVYDTIWQEPTEHIDALYLDRASILKIGDKKSLLNYLDEHQDVKIAYWANKDILGSPDFCEELARRSLLAFVDTRDTGINSADESEVKRIAEKFLSMGVENIVVTNKKDIYLYSKTYSAKLSWSLGEKTDLYTSLTTKSIISSSILGGFLLDKSPTECLLLAKYNVESSTLNASLSINSLKELIIRKDYEVEIMEDTSRDESPVEEKNLASQLVQQGKGILAADESDSSIKRKFEQFEIDNTEENRRNYRNLFFSAPDINKYLTGVILYDETVYQRADNDKPFPEFLQDQGIIPGIKVDKGLRPLDGFDGETVSAGLDDLDERLDTYKNLGLRFTKWRAAFEIKDGTPSDAAIAANVHVLARYAKIVQSKGMVPIVEPEVVYDGYFTLDQCKSATSRMLYALFSELELMQVKLEDMILKTNMVLAGKQFDTQSTPEEIATATAEVLREQVPERVAGVVFLSGGQSYEQATNNLQAITNLGPYPWPVTFSYARALQEPAVQIWHGEQEKVGEAQAAFIERLEANCQALQKQS